MNKFLSLLLIAIVSMGLLFTEAQAKRFGGGRSMGMQRSMSAPHMAPAAAATRSAAGASRWLGPLAGLALGGLLGYFLMQNGIGAGFMSWILLAGVLALLWMVMRKFMHRHSAAGSQYNSVQQPGLRESSLFTAGQATNPSPSVPTYPAGFDAADFIRNAKVQFYRLQAAYDSANLNDLRDFTTPEIFAESQMQIKERGDQPNVTEVVHLDGKILEAINTENGVLVSMEFSGMIRENPGEEAHLFKETWHFIKDNDRQKWLVAGIQLDGLSP